MNQEKTARALHGTVMNDGRLSGGVMKDGKYDDDSLLAEYDRIGGLIRDEEGNKVKTGSFYDFENRKPRSKPDVTLVFRIEGRVVEVPHGKEMPKVVEAQKALAAARVADAEEDEEKPKKRAKKAKVIKK